MYVRKRFIAAMQIGPVTTCHRKQIDPAAHPSSFFKTIHSRKKVYSISASIFFSEIGRHPFVVIVAHARGRPEGKRQRTRVTRSDEFSPFGQLFTFGKIVEN
jgi:hypothetical protein